MSLPLKEAAIFDSPKGGLNGVEKVETYDVLIITPLKLRYPPLTQFGHKIANIANRTMMVHCIPYLDSRPLWRYFRKVDSHITDTLKRVLLLTMILLNASSAMVSNTSVKWTVSNSIASVVMLSNDMVLRQTCRSCSNIWTSHFICSHVDWLDPSIL